MNFDINNKIAVITGANRGIGLAITHAFLKNGAKKVYLAVRDTDTVSPLLAQYGDRVQAVQVDVADKASIQQLAQTTQDAELVVNNAGVLQSSGVTNKEAENSLQYEFNINTLGLLRMAQAYEPILSDKPSAAFVQLNSVASIKNFEPFSTYSASKAAAYSLTQGLKDGWSNNGIQVLSVHPGPIDTDMAKQAGFNESESADVVANDIIQALANGKFHSFPDTVAKQVESLYHDYSVNIIEPVATS